MAWVKQLDPDTYAPQWVFFQYDGSTGETYPAVVLTHPPALYDLMMYDDAGHWWETAQRYAIQGSYQGGVINPRTGAHEPFVPVDDGSGAGQRFLPLSVAQAYRAQNPQITVGSEVRPPDFQPGMFDDIGALLLKAAVAAATSNFMPDVTSIISGQGAFIPTFAENAAASAIDAVQFGTSLAPVGTALNYGVVDYATPATVPDSVYDAIDTTPTNYTPVVPAPPSVYDAIDTFQTNFVPDTVPSVPQIPTTSIFDQVDTQPTNYGNPAPYTAPDLPNVPNSPYDQIDTQPTNYGTAAPYTTPTVPNIPNLPTPSLPGTPSPVPGLPNITSVLPAVLPLAKTLLNSGDTTKGYIPTLQQPNTLLPRTPGVFTPGTFNPPSTLDTVIAAAKANPLAFIGFGVVAFLALKG